MRRPSATAAGTASGAATVDTQVPAETAGPFPGDGSNGPDVLDDTGIVRRDLRSSIGTSTTTATGVPLTVNLTVLDSADGYGAMEGVAVYVWHCDAQGRYSMYSPGVEDENYLRGVQPTDASGTATFTTVFPGCYPGRWPHIHFEVYRSTAEATSAGQIVRTSQIALPQAACEAVYADTATYPGSADDLSGTSLTQDMVFGDDGGIHQLATVTGDATQRLRREPHRSGSERGHPARRPASAPGAGAGAIGSSGSPPPRGGDARPRPGAVRPT